MEASWSKQDHISLIKTIAVLNPGSTVYDVLPSPSSLYCQDCPFCLRRGTLRSHTMTAAEGAGRSSACFLEIGCRGHHSRDVKKHHFKGSISEKGSRWLWIKRNNLLKAAVRAQNLDQPLVCISQSCLMKKDPKHPSLHYWWCALAIRRTGLFICTLSSLSVVYFKCNKCVYINLFEFSLVCSQNIESASIADRFIHSLVKIEIHLCFHKMFQIKQIIQYVEKCSIYKVLTHLSLSFF